MRDLISLFKIQFLSANGLNGSGRKKKAANSVGTVLFTVLLMAAAFVGFGYIYSDMFAVSLAASGEIYKLVPVMLAISVFVNFFFSFYSSASALFGFKDYELLSSMPVKTRDVVLAKFMNMYVADLFFSVCIMIPSFIVNAQQGGAADAAFIATYALVILFSPLFAMAASVIVGVAISSFASLFRRRNLVNTVLMLVFMAAFLAFSFSVGFNSAEGDASGYTGAIEIIYFFTPWLIKAQSEFVFAVYFILVNVACFAAVAVAVILLYGKLNSLLTARRKVKNFTLKESSGKSAFSALFGKELRRVFSCPTYAINCITGAIMSVILAVVLVVVSFAVGFPDGVGDVLVAFFPAVFSFTFMLAPTTVCAVSLEGQAFWVVKTAPVEMRALFHAKLLVNAVFYVPCALVVSVASALVLKISAVTALLAVLSAVLLALLGGSFGLLMNAIFPRFKWENENMVVKQSLPVFLTMILAFVLAGLFGVAALFVDLPAVWLLFIADALLFAANIVVYVLLMKKGEKFILKKL